MGGRLSEWRANRAFRDRVVSEVLEPAGAGPLGRDSFQIDLIRDYVVEIGLGRAMDGSEQWIEMLWRCPRFPRVMTRLQEDEPDLAEAWRGVGRTRFTRTGYGVIRAGAVPIEADGGRLVIRSYRDRDGALREKDFDAPGYFKGLAAISEMNALVEECNFGLAGQVLASLSGVWSYLFLATDQGGTPEEVFEAFEGPGYAGVRRAWRMKAPLTVAGIERFQAAFAAELGG